MAPRTLPLILMVWLGILLHKAVDDIEFPSRHCRRRHPEAKDQISRRSHIKSSSIPLQETLLQWTALHQSHYSGFWFFRFTV
jgi:hypothetical protein